MISIMDALIHGQEIADRFALGTAVALTGPNACGQAGELWRLTTDAGHWAVHRRCAYAVGAELTESAALQRAACSGGIPAPAVRHTCDGGVMARIGGAMVRVEDWIALGPPVATIDPVAVGQLAAALHHLPFCGSLRFDPWFHAAVGDDRWRDIVNDSRAVGAAFADEVAAVAEELAALSSLVVAPAQPQICHRDLTAANLRRGPTGRLWVIGWHLAGLTDPAYELAALLFDHADDDPGRARLIRDAYVEAGGPARMRHPADFSMVIARRGHELEMACRRWLSAAASATDRAHSESTVAQLVGRPLTRSTIDRILAATS